MKHQLFLFAFCFAAFSFFFGCSNSKGEKKAVELQGEKPSKAVLFFVDKSKSVAIVPEKKDRYLRDLASFLDDDMKALLNRELGVYAVALCLIHGNTIGSGQVEKWEIEAPAKIDPNLGGADQRRKQQQMRRDIHGQYKEVLSQLKSYLFAPSDYESSKSTDIWAAFEVMSDFFARYAYAEKQVVFISDMVEATTGEDRRNFRKSPPRSKSEAHSFAEEDFSKITKLYEVSPSILKDGQVFFWSTSEVGSENNFRFLKYYWKTLFKKFGMIVAN